MSTAFLKFYWQRRLNRVFLIATAIQFTAGWWSSVSYFFWTIWVLAMSTAWFAVFFTIRSTQETIRDSKARRVQLDFWLHECERICDTLCATPMWDTATRDELRQQYQTAHTRFQQEMKAFECPSPKQNSRS